MRKLYLSLFLAALCAYPVQVSATSVRTDNTLSVAASSCTATGTVCLIVPVDVNQGGATFTISTNASANTIQFEASGDGGTTWVALSVTPSNSTTAVTSTTSTGTWQANVAGYTHVRMRMSTLVSGTNLVSITQSTASARSNGGGGGGGSGTVSGQANGVIPLGTTATTITQQSHLDDGNTTAATITSSEPINASSVGTGASPPTAILAGVTGGIGFTEGAVACTPTAGQDCIRAANTHQIVASVNGGSEAPLAQFTGSITGTKCLQSSSTLGLITEAGGACSVASTAIPEGSGAGSVNVMTVTTVPAVATNAAGTIVAVLPNLANTIAAPTLAVGGQTALTITKYGTAALVGSDYTTTAIAYFVSDGTHWQLLNPQATPTYTGASLTNNGVVIGGVGSNQLHTLANTCLLPGTLTCAEVDVDGANGKGSFDRHAAAGCETSFGATTLSTGATTTTTGVSCLPANAIIDAVVYRVTTAITTAATFEIGDGTIAGRFSGGLSSTPCGGALTLNATGICFTQADQTGTSGPRQTAAAAIVITTNANPGAGALRLFVYYHTWVAPTS